MTAACPGLEVVPALPRHLADLPSWFDSAEALAQWGGPFLRHPLTPDQIESLLAETATRPPGRLVYAGLVGEAVVAHAEAVLDWTNGVARLAHIAVCPAWRGKGIARPMLRRVIDNIRAVGDFPRLELNVYTFNAPAIALYESLGFTREGVRRSSAKVGDRRWDTAIYAIVRD